MEQNTNQPTTNIPLAQALASGLTLTTQQIIQITLSVINQAKNFQGPPPSFCPQAIHIHTETLTISLTQTSSNTRHPAPDTTEGQPVFFAPEQYTGGKIGPHTQVFHIGILLHYLSTGAYPLFNAFSGFDLALDTIEFPQIKRMIEKLLAYSLLDRYSGLDSIAKDLLTCLTHLETTQTIAYFALDNTPSINQLMAYHLDDPQFVSTFQETWEITQTHKLCITFINGPPGVGKTSHVQQTAQPLASQWFTYGKCMSAPGQVYQALFSILEQAIQTAYATAIPQLNQAKIHQLLHQINLELSPTGKLTQPAKVDEKAEFEWDASFMHFHRILIQLFGVLTRVSPLVICLDDVQWADPGTLALIEDMATHYPDLPIWLILIYRSTEPNPTLLQLISRVSTQNSQVNHIQIHPFDTEKLTTFLTEYFQFETPEYLPLYVAQVMEKTGGTPFFIKQFLMDQIEKSHLTFLPTTHRWHWDTLALEHTPIMDNAAHLISAKSKQLSQDTTRTLAIAATIGLVFPLKLLAIVVQKQETEVALALWPAIQAHFIAPVSATEYRFLHDTLHTTFLDSLPPAEKQASHYKIATSINLVGTPSIFDHVNHYNDSDPTHWDDILRYHVATLNLQAGQQALQQAAFSVAVFHLKHGLALIQHLGWSYDYQVIFDFHLYLGKALFLEGQDQDAQHYFKLAADHATSKIASLKIAIAQVELFHHIDKSPEAISYAKKAGLAHEIPIKINCLNKLCALLEYRKIHKNYITQESPLSDQQSCSEEEQKYIQQLMCATLTCLYFVDTNAYAYLTLRAFRDVLQTGQTPFSQALYATTAIFLMHGSRDYHFAISVSERALENTIATPATQTITFTILGGCILPYYRNLRECMILLKKARQIGSTTGNIVFANYAYNFLYFFKFLLGTPLQVLEKKLEEHLQFTQQTHELWSEQYTLSFIRMVHRLQNPNQKTQATHTTENIDWISREQNLKDRKKFLILVLDGLFEAIPLYLARDFTQTLEALQKTAPYLPYILGMIHSPIFEWLHALTLLWQYDTLTRWNKFKAHRKIKKITAHLKQLTDLCPTNFRIPLLILSAKAKSVLENTITTEWEYQHMIDVAQADGFLFFALIAADTAAHELGLSPEKRNHFKQEHQRIATQWGLNFH